MTQDAVTQDAATGPQGSGETSAGEESHPPSAVRSLQQAMRRARADNAERAGVLADLKAAQIGRLDLLAEALKPLMAQIPSDVDMFDLAVMPGSTPRLFVDMLGFVEMGRDARVYSFIQDRRHGRFVLAESEAIETMVDAVTDYVARRLLEREKALAADLGRPARPPGAAADGAMPLRDTGQGRARSLPASAAAPSAEGEVQARRGLPGWMRLVATVFSFFIEVLGAIAFFVLLAFVAWLAWLRFHGTG